MKVCLGEYLKLEHQSLTEIEKIVIFNTSHKKVPRFRPCLHGVGDPGLVRQVSFVFTLWRTKNKRNLPH